MAAVELMIRVIDDVLPDPSAYRARALARSFLDVTLGADTFRGIAVCPRGGAVAAAAAGACGASPVLSFFRRSPLGQPEPNYVHTDETMGRFTAIYYMNPQPAEGDGTRFWKRGGDDWQPNELVEARFNRLLLFDAGIPHSRALFDNYGQGDGARLIQVVFLR